MKYKPFFKKENNLWVGMGSCPGLIIKRKIKIDVLLKEVYNE